MIEVTLTNNSGFSGWTHFIHSIDASEEILIEDCCRCIGLLFFWERKKDCPKGMFVSRYAVSAFHIPPYERKPKTSRRQFFDIINRLSNYFDLREVAYCGGKIDTKTNAVHYERSKNFFLFPLQHLFPQSVIHGLEPTSNQHSSGMYMNEFLEVVFDRTEYATES